MRDTLFPDVRKIFKISAIISVREACPGCIALHVCKCLLRGASRIIGDCVDMLALVVCGLFRVVNLHARRMKYRSANLVGYVRALYFPGAPNLHISGCGE